MKISHVEISGFRAYRETTELDMSQASGLVLVRGSNEKDERLKSNGAGKTTFFDAIAWCLIGETARGAKGPAVESINGDGKVSVRLTIDHQDQSYLLERTRKPIALLLDGEPITQKVLEDFLGFRARDFLNAVLIGQFSKLFPDLGPSDRLNYVSQLLNLELWTDLSKKARAEEKSADASYCEAEKESTVHGAILKQLQDDIDNARAELAELVAKSGPTDSLEDVVREASVTILGWEEKIDAVEAKIRSHRNAKAIANKKFTDLDGESRKALHDLVRAEERLEAAQRELEGLKTADPMCGTCGSMIDPADFQDEIARLAEQVSELDGLAASQAKKCKLLDAEADRLADTTAQAHERINKGLRRRDELRQELASVERRHVEATVALEAARTNSSRIEARIQKKEKKVHSRRRALRKVQTQLDTLSTAVSRNRFWSRAFKDLRLWKLDTAMHMLAVTANSALQDLGLVGWELRFYSEKPNSTVRGFYIDVAAPGMDPRPLEDCSGGELQRLRIACATGLADLIRSTLPHAPQFEVWDEPTAHLSDAGVWDLVEFFSVRSKDRTIFFVDHRVLDSGSFTRILDVVKTNQGSTVSWA